jgi:hypothetical protein
MVMPNWFVLNLKLECSNREWVISLKNILRLKEYDPSISRSCFGFIIFIFLFHSSTSCTLYFCLPPVICFQQMYHLVYLSTFNSFCILHVSLSGLFILSVQPVKMVYYVSLTPLYLYISQILPLTLKILHYPLVIFLQMKERKSILFTLLIQKYFISNDWILQFPFTFLQQFDFIFSNKRELSIRWLTVLYEQFYLYFTKF